MLEFGAAHLAVLVQHRSTDEFRLEFVPRHATSALVLFTRDFALGRQKVSVRVPTDSDEKIFSIESPFITFQCIF